MKTKLTLLISALALSGYSYAGPSDGAAFAMRHAQEASARKNATANVAVADSASFKYVPSFNTKGGISMVATRETPVTSIALAKSSNKAGCDGAACCAKK